MPPLSYKYTGGLPRWIYRALAPEREQLADFRGGLNLRDYPSGLLPTDLAQAYNIEIDRDGRGISAILGYDDGTNLSLAAVPNGGALAAFSSRLGGGVVIVQDMTGLFWRTSDFASFTATMSGSPPPVTAGGVWGVDFTGKIVVAAPKAGVYILDPGTWVWSLATNAVQPEMLAVWQNKVWAIRDPNFPTRVWACNAGTPQTWSTSTDWVDIREPNDDVLTCIVATQEQDFQGRPSLLVYKRRSVHRINSPNAVTGFAFTTLATGVGAFGKNCAVVVQNEVISIDENGLWVTDGVKVPIKAPSTGRGDTASDKVRPLFTILASCGLGSAPYGVADESGICSVVRDNRVYFSLPSGIGNQLNELLCYDASIGAVTLVRWDSVDNPAVAYRYAAMFSTSPQGNVPRYWLLRQGNTVVRQLFVGGPTGGGLPAVVSRWQTAFLSPMGGTRMNARRLHLWARLVDALTLTIYKDFVTSAVSVRTLPGDGPSAVARPRPVWSLGKPRAISFQFDYTRTTLSAFTWDQVGIHWDDAGVTWGPLSADGQGPGCNLYAAFLEVSRGGDI